MTPWSGPEPPIVDRHAPEVPGINVYKIGGYIRLSPQMAEELRLAAMGPEQGPPVPKDIAMRRRLGGHPAGPYRRMP